MDASFDDRRPANDRRRAIQRLSRLADWASLAGIAAVAGYGAALAFDPDALLIHLQRDVPGRLFSPSGQALALAYGLSLAPVALFVAALWQARLFFRLLGRASLFDARAPRILHRLGALAIASAVAGILFRTLVVLAMTSGNPPGERQLVIGFASSEVSALVAGLLVYAFALIMQEALAIEDENRSFI